MLRASITSWGCIKSFRLAMGSHEALITKFPYRRSPTFRFTRNAEYGIENYSRMSFVKKDIAVTTSKNIILDLLYYMIQANRTK